MNSLQGRVALVSGSSRGIGASVSRLLAAEGARLSMVSRSGDALGIPGALAQACDVRDAAQVAAAATATAERFGGIDIVVANAGVGAYGDFLSLDPQHLEEIIDVNVKGLLYTVRAVLPFLLASDAAELFVVASVAGQAGPEGEAVYAASKFAQVGFMRALDHELWRQGVRCQMLCPGGVATDFAMGRGRTPEDPDLANFMTPDEVAEFVVQTLKRPRTHRVLEANMLPMNEDSMG
ncbi:MAG: short-chain dehydrogenase/reductase SDR [Pseudonocardiales bacterium]|nr:MAG: short-chain dehydrogenase/reductase SDR [Pseudonocardiales bacterium]